MSGAAEIGSPRPRPLSGGFWTLLSWLRREEHSSSNESLSSAGSDRTAVSFAFLAPAHYHGSAPPITVPPPGPPTDTYKQRVRERNLRRQYDRDITLHRKYGLFRGEGFTGFDASTLPSSRRVQGAVGAQERERRATSECYQRRAAHVPGKRRAPPPPAISFARCDSLQLSVTVTSINRRTARKRRAPQPPVKIVEEKKENINITTAISMNDHTENIEATVHDNLNDCKPEKYIKKDIKDKTKPEKSFLKQIFENKKRNSSIDITTVKVLPSISELDAQAAEIIENSKLKNNEAINHQIMIRAVKENCCTKCFKKPCTCTADMMPLNLEQNQNKNASIYTQTENALKCKVSNKNDELDEKQKLKEMLKEMKYSLPNKTKHENIKPKNIACSSSNKSSVDNTSVTETPTLKIGSYINNNTNISSNQASSNIITRIPQKKNDLTQNKNKHDKESNTPMVVVKDMRVKNATKPKTNNSNEPEITINESNKKPTPLKISSLLNPIYIPKETTFTQKLPTRVDVDGDPKDIKPRSEQDKMKTADAVRDIVLNSAFTKNPKPTPTTSQQLNQTIKGESNKTPCINKVSVEPICVKSRNVINGAASVKDKNEHSNGERLSQHLRRRELVTKLEQSIAKGDEQAAAEAASKLAQLKLTCSVLSFTSQILSEPSTSKIRPERSSPQRLIDDLKSPPTPPTNLAVSVTPNDNIVIVARTTKPTTSSNKVQIERQSTANDNAKTSKNESITSIQQATTSKGLSAGTNTHADAIAIDVWVEDKEKTRGPIKLFIKGAAAVGDLRRQAEQTLGLPTRLQRWIIGRTLCNNDDTPLVTLAGPSLNSPFYLYLVESDTKTDRDRLPKRTSEKIDGSEKNDIETKSSDVYNELVKLERQALVPNAEVFECEICMEQCKSGDGVVLRECVHSFCKNCLADVIRHCEEPAVLCPATGCPGELHEREIRALVTPEEYERWLARGLAAAESGTRNAFHCRTRDCTGWALCDVGVRRFPCPVCQRSNCVPCQAIHENETCEQHRAKLLAAAASGITETDEGTRALIDSLITRGEALQCPECSAIITKKWGCDWVKCSACKTEICWVTRGRRWGPAGRGDTTGGCRCGVDGKRCHPSCGYCH